MQTKEVHYSDYLQLDKILNAQALESELQGAPAHDEMLFIIIHQAYELWFKQILFEIDSIAEIMGRKVINDNSPELQTVVHRLGRIDTILKVAVHQIDILETMTPMSFTSFRNRLETSSGFQSSQFREMEFLLGFKRPEMLKYCDPDSAGYAAVEKRLNSPSLIDHFYEFLALRNVLIPPDLLIRDVRLPTEPNEEIQDALHHLYLNDREVSIVFELMTDFDEGLQEWRYRHVKLVERTIGNKHGTGGSLGVEFLKRSLFQPIFPDLWAIRHRL